MRWTVFVQSNCSYKALSPVVHGDIELSINTNTNMIYNFISIIPTSHCSEFDLHAYIQTKNIKFVWGLFVARCVFCFGSIYKDSQVGIHIRVGHIQHHTVFPAHSKFVYMF